MLDHFPTKESRAEAIKYIKGQNFKEITTLVNLIEDILAEQERIMKILQVHVTPQVMELILNA